MKQQWPLQSSGARAECPPEVVKLARPVGFNEHQRAFTCVLDIVTPTFPKYPTVTGLELQRAVARDWEPEVRSVSLAHALLRVYRDLHRKFESPCRRASRERCNPRSAIDDVAWRLNSKRDTRLSISCHKLRLWHMTHPTRCYCANEAREGHPPRHGQARSR